MKLIIIYFISFAEIIIRCLAGHSMQLITIYFMPCAANFSVVGTFYLNSMKLNSVRKLLWHFHLIEHETQLNTRHTNSL